MYEIIKRAHAAIRMEVDCHHNIAGVIESPANSQR